MFYKISRLSGCPTVYSREALTFYWLQMTHGRLSMWPSRSSSNCPRCWRACLLWRIVSASTFVVKLRVFYRNHSWVCRVFWTVILVRFPFQTVTKHTRILRSLRIIHATFSADWIKAERSVAARASAISHIWPTRNRLCRPRGGETNLLTTLTPPPQRFRGGRRWSEWS